MDKGEHSRFMYQEYSSRCRITLESQNSRCVRWEHKNIMPVFGCLNVCVCVCMV